MRDEASTMLFIDRRDDRAAGATPPFAAVVVQLCNSYVRGCLTARDQCWIRAAAAVTDDDVKAGFGSGCAEGRRAGLADGKERGNCRQRSLLRGAQGTPQNFFIPPKEGPWTCIEVDGNSDESGSAKLRRRMFSGSCWMPRAFRHRRRRLTLPRKRRSPPSKYTFPKGWRYQ